MFRRPGAATRDGPIYVSECVYVCVLAEPGTPTRHGRRLSRRRRLLDPGRRASVSRCHALRPSATHFS